MNVLVCEKDVNLKSSVAKCYGLKVCAPPPNSYIEASTQTVFGNIAYEVINKGLS